VVRPFPLDRFLPVLVLAASLVAPGMSRAATSSPDSPLAALRIGADDPGCAVLVRRAGRTEFEAAAGVRRRGGPLLDRHTRFRLASLTKPFTAMAVVEAVAQGRLRYDATLYDLLPGFPDWARAITVRHLLTHTSGVPDYEDAMDAEAAAGGARYTETRQIQDADVLALLKRQREPRFPAGARWAYSNSGYVLLGLILSRVDGQPFGEVLRRRIFAPLGMHDTVLFRAGHTRLAARAFGHEPSPEGLVLADQSSTSATQGDGGVYSSLADLARWDDALERHVLVPEATMRAALTPVTLADGSGTRWPEQGDEDDLAPGQPVAYGYGWFLDPFEGRARMWHFGTTRGFHNAIMRFPGERLTTVALCNRTDIDARALALRLATPRPPEPSR
jgi:CubicO group peptidase (beta-lactamase class C family)